MSKDRDFKAEAERIIAEAEAIATHRTSDIIRSINENSALELPENRRDFLKQAHARYLLEHRRCKAAHSNLSLLPENRASLNAMFAELLGRQAKGIDTSGSIRNLVNIASFCEAIRRTMEAAAAALKAQAESNTPQEPKAEPEPLPTFTELFFNKANADKVRGLMPSNGKYVKSICFAMATELHHKGYCPKYSKEVIARVLAAEFYDLKYPEYFREKRYIETDIFEDFRKLFYDRL